MHGQTSNISVRVERLWRERRPLVIAAIIVAIGLPVGFAVVQTTRNGPSPLDVSRTQAQTLTSKGQYVQAYETLKSSASRVSTTAERVALYGELAAAAANANKKAEAIDYLETRHELDPSTAPGDAYMLATLYDAKGDTAKALNQYRAAITYLQSLPSDQSVTARIKSLRAIVAAREGSSQ